MSTGYAIRCQTHPNEWEDHHFGLEQLRTVLHYRDELSSLADFAFAILPIVLGSGWLPELIEWMGRHHRCHLLIVDEYGRAMLVDGEATA